MLISCLDPQTIRNKSTGKIIKVPCGKCVVCQSLKQYDWQKRLETECSFHKYTKFVNLSYSNDFLPVDRNIPADVLCQFDAKSNAIFHIYGGVPYVDVHDLQLFFKNFRNLLKKYNINEKIRYYYLAEIGSSTFRPHIHMLVWFSDDRVFKLFESLVYQAWVAYDKDKRSSRLRGNVVIKDIGVSACRYVTAYITSSSLLPNCFALTGHPQFTEKSKCPPIGQHSQLSTFDFQSQYGMSYETRVYDAKLSELANVSFRSYNIAYLYPKCYKFSSLSDSDKYRMYQISLCVDGEDWSDWFNNVRSLCQTYTKTYELNQYHSYSPNSVFEQFILDYFTQKDGNTYLWETNRLRQAYYTSRKVIKRAHEYHMPLSRYISLLLEYYKRADYMALKKQIEYEQQLSDSCALRFYPLIIDDTIINNERKLDDSYRDSLLTSFGYTDFAKEYPLFTAKQSAEYQNVKALYDKLFKDSIKSKVKNDYLRAHPEFNELYNLL